MMKNITCFCEHSFEIDIPEIYDLEKDEDLYSSILTGDFMAIQCPVCNTILKPEFPIRLIDNRKKIDIFFIPEMDRTAYLLGNLTYSIDNPNRIVIGYKELVEKISIRKENLNDQAIELIKYYILIKAKKELDTDEIKIFFQQLSNNTIVFYIEGIRKDEIGKYEIQIDIYERILKEIDSKIQDPTFSSFLNPPYISLNRIYME